MTRALSQRLKSKGRLLVVDFFNDGNLEKLFAQAQDHSHSHGEEHAHGHGHSHGHGDAPSHVVAHKPGKFFCGIFLLIYLILTGFSSEQMIDMFKAADLQNPQVEVH